MGRVWGGQGLEEIMIVGVEAGFTATYAQTILESA